jgi:oligosaccharide repeat unit polymerase
LPVSLWSRVTLVFLYVTPLYGGYLLPLLKGKKRIWTYATLLPPLLMALTLSVKSTFITSVVLWGIGVLVSAYANNRGFWKVGKATLLKGLAGGMLFLGVLFLSMVLRTGQFDRASVRQTETKIVVYACGHLPAFDVWFQNNVGHLKPTWGVKTFYGISGPLGLAKREPGVFTDYVELVKQQGKPVPHLMDTNVYTLFRFLLEDFGLLGSAVVILLAGMLGGYAWLQVRKRPSGALFQVVLMAILFTIAWSFVGSVWAYTSYFATMLLMVGLVKASFWKSV